MYNPRRGYPSVVLYVRYRDPEAAIRWLSAVLGAREAVRMTLPDGRIGHAELILGGQVIILGLAVTEKEMDRPADRNAMRAMTLVFVSDVDASASRSVELGGVIVEDPADMPWGCASRSSPIPKATSGNSAPTSATWPRKPGAPSRLAPGSMDRFTRSDAVGCTGAPHGWSAGTLR